MTMAISALTATALVVILIWMILELRRK